MTNQLSRLSPVVMEEMTDQREIAEAQRHHERAERNQAWLQAHVPEIYSRYRGKCICVAGEELFVAETPEAVLAQARAAHPEENGSIIIRYIPQKRMAWVYANQR